MRLKRVRDLVPYVDPPDRTWPYAWMKATEKFKPVAPSTMDDKRHEASTRENIQSWFTKIENDAAPARYFTHLSPPPKF